MSKKDYGADGYYYDTFGDFDFGSALKEFTGGPDKKFDSAGIINFIFRGKIPDDRKAVALAGFLTQCEDCNDIRHMRQALLQVASWSAVDADRIHTLLQATVGQLDGHKNNGPKKRPWDKKDEDTVKVDKAD